MLVAWVLAPALLTILALGAGLLVERAAGWRLPWPAVPGVGLAGLLVLGTATTSWAPTATWTAAAMVAIPALGFVLGWPRLRSSVASLRARGADSPARRRAFGTALLAAAGTFLVHGAPVLASGTPTFLGWIKLDDGSTWMAMTDRLVSAGRTTAGLADSTYEAALGVNWEGLYPTGAFPLLGVAGQLLGQDLTQLIQPYMAWLAALLALSLVALLRSADARLPGWAAFGAFVAAQSALLVAYAWWGGVKELTLAPLVVLAALAATGPWRGSRDATQGIGPGAVARRGLGLAVIAAAVVAVASAFSAAWALVPCLVFLALAIRRTGTRAGIGGSLAVALALIALSTPSLMVLSWADIAEMTDFATMTDDVGTLWGPLSPWQLVGIWPVLDFRGTPERLGPVLLVLLAAIGLATWGIVHAVRRRDWALVTYLAAAMPIALVATRGGPWLAGKSLAIASPAILAAAFVGVAALRITGRRFEAVVGAGALTFGVLASNALGYRATWLAPADEVAELRTIGSQLDLEAPALMLDYSPYGSRYLLRALDAQGAGELRRWEIPTTTGAGLGRAAYGDIDDFPTASLAPFNTLVVRRSTTASRPPSDFALAWEGRTYEAWQRTSSDEVEHVPLGDHSDPAAVPECAAIEDVAERAAPGQRLAFAERGPVARAALTGPLPVGWSTGANGEVYAPTSGVATATLEIAQGGRYEGWVAGGFRGRLEVLVDGTVILDERHKLVWSGHGRMTDAIMLEAGTHAVEYRYSGSDWRPGSVGVEFGFGPLVMGTQTAADVAWSSVEPVEASTLCGRRLDWLAVVR